MAETPQIEEMEDWQFYLYVLGTMSETFKKVEDGLGIFLPVTVAGVSGMIVKAIWNSSLEPDKKRAYAITTFKIATMIIAAWGLKHSESLAAEAGCIAILGIAPFSDRIADFADDPTILGDWIWKQSIELLKATNYPTISEFNDWLDHLFD